MILEAFLSTIGANPGDKGHDHVAMRDEATGTPWVVILHVEPEGPVGGSIIRVDPGTMGRTLFHFRASPRDGRHDLDYLSLNGALTSAPLPSLPALCAFMRIVWGEMAAERLPDLEGLALLHLGMALHLPPVEVRPGDRACYLDFGPPD